jgi:hypothetical protein
VWWRGLGAGMVRSVMYGYKLSKPLSTLSIKGIANVRKKQTVKTGYGECRMEDVKRSIYAGFVDSSQVVAENYLKYCCLISMYCRLQFSQMFDVKS